MKAVGLKQLKARLSEYVRFAKSGETILITERDHVVAEIRPVRRYERPPDDVERALEALADAGEVTRARWRKPGWRWSTRGLGLPAGSAQAMLDEARSDRLD